MSEKKTVITVHVPESQKDRLQGYMGDVTFKELVNFVEGLFSEEYICVAEGGLCLVERSSADSPALKEFYDACDSISLDREFGLKKATAAVKRRQI